MNIWKKVAISLLTLTSAFLYKKAGPEWIAAWGIDSVTYLFLCFLPIIWLFKISWKINALVAILFSVLMAIFSLLKFEKTSENMAILVFFFFATSVFQRIKKLMRSKKQQ